MRTYTSFRQPAVVLVITISAMFLSRVVSSIWLWDRHEARSHFIPILWTNLGIELLLVAIGFFIVRRWVRQDRSRRAEQSRFDHAADIALMAGGFAHEARNHIHAMQTHFALLRKSLPENDGKYHERVSKLEEVAGSLDHLFTDFLTFARPTRDEWRETDLGRLVQEVVEFESLEFENTGVELVVELLSPLPAIYVDQGKLKRALLNLLINARQAIDGGGKVTIRLNSIRGRVRIEVEDTGAGIPLAEQSHIFETFFSTKSEGTGLGLAVVRRTMEDAGGRITFSSQPGKGTTFVISLPTLKSHKATVHRRAQDHASVMKEPTAAAG